MLQHLLGSQCRAEILRNLFTPERKNTHLRELSRQAGLSAPVLQRELRKLTHLGIIVAEKDGNRINFSANHRHLLFPVLCQLVQKTEGCIAVLQDCFSDCPADFIFVFGSYAKDTANAASDIDLFVIGDCGLREVTRRIHQAAEKIDQVINPYVITPHEYQERYKNQDHFILEVARSPKIFLKGSPDEFKAMGS